MKIGDIVYIAGSKLYYVVNGTLNSSFIYTLPIKFINQSSLRITRYTDIFQE
jgi:hypothetical protein